MSTNSTGTGPRNFRRLIRNLRKKRPRALRELEAPGELARDGGRGGPLRHDALHLRPVRGVHVAFASDEEVAFASDEEDAYASDEEDAYAVAAIAAIAVKPSVTRDRARLALQSLALKLAEVDCDRAASMAIVGEGLSWPFRAIEVEQLARTVVALAREAGEAPAAPILEPTVIPSVTIAERPPTPRYGDRMRLELAFDALESALALRSELGAEHLEREAWKLLAIGRELGLASRTARIDPSSTPGVIRITMDPPAEWVVDVLPVESKTIAATMRVEGLRDGRWYDDGFVVGPTYDLSGLIDPPLAVVDPLTHDEGEG